MNRQPTEICGPQTDLIASGFNDFQSDSSRILNKHTCTPSVGWIIEHGKCHFYSIELMINSVPQDAQRKHLSSFWKKNEDNPTSDMMVKTTELPLINIHFLSLLDVYFNSLMRLCIAFCKTWAKWDIHNSLRFFKLTRKTLDWCQWQ